MARLKTVGCAVAFSAVLSAAASPGCDGSDADTRVVAVTVQYPIESIRGEVSSLHFWVLEPGRSDYLDGGCRWLVAQESDPYDVGYRRHADFVVTEPRASTGASGPVPTRYALVYAEAVSYDGSVLWVACEELESGKNDAFVTLRLVNPGSYDCADPRVEPHSPCDDGLYCTLGERCVNGECKLGGPRSCAHLGAVCQVGKCDETIGCYLAPVADGSYCEDDVFCTVQDWCEQGVCKSGVTRDCGWAESQCRRGVCDESLDSCFGLPDDTLTCDDGFDCIVDEVCRDGVCVGTDVSCTHAGDACNLGYCSEALQGGCARAPDNEDGPCDSHCTTGGICQAGVCAGGTPTGATDPEGPAGDPTCTDFVDNDCDTYLDGDDPDCAS